MRESKNNTILNQYLREKRMYCYYELKVVKGGRFNFGKIEDNQDQGLPALAREGLVWKLSDEDSRKKPCDGFCTPPLPSYLVLKFDNTFYFIEYSKIVDFKAAGYVSIDLDEVKKISTQVVHA